MRQLVHVAYLSLLTLGVACHLEAEPARHSLDEYGDISKPETAALALQKGIEELVKAGGGILEIPPNAPAALQVENLVTLGVSHFRQNWHRRR